MSESQRDIPVDEPPLPTRIRRPSDAIRFLVAVTAIGLVLLLASIASQTTSGIGSDIAHGTKSAPGLLFELSRLIAGFGVLIVPVAFAVERLYRRDGLRIAIGVLAVAIAVGVTLGLDAWVDVFEPSGDLWTYLTEEDDAVSVPGPFETSLAPVIAYLTAVRMTGRPRWQAAAWTVIALSALASVTAGGDVPLTLGVTYLLGRAVGYGTLYFVGSPNTRPPGAAVVVALQRVGLCPVRAWRLPDGPEETRRYGVDLDDGRLLDVTVLDRDQQTAGQLYRLWRLIRLRGGNPRRTIRSVRRSLEQEALMAYAVAAAGANTPCLVATCEIDIDASLLAYEHVDGQTLAATPTTKITDEVMAGAWEQVRILHERRIAHRHLGDDAVVLSGDRLYLTDLRAGEIASSDLILRLDLAQMLTSLAMRVGPERAVRSAALALGPDRMAGVLPLLQRVALSRATRTALRGNQDLLSQIREELQNLRPQLEIEPVRLERIRFYTLLTIIAATVGGYITLTRLGEVKFDQVVSNADWRWAIVGAGASVATYWAAAMMLMGFVPERLPWGRTVLVQLAASFIKLVAPAAVSGAALNARYLQRRGTKPGQAVASVGASQITGMGVHLTLLLILGFVTSSRGASFAPSRKTIIALLVVAAVVIVVTAIPPIRRFATGRLRPLFSGVVPRMLDVLQSPKKLAQGVGGPLLLQALFVLCLDTAIRAFGGELNLTVVAFVFLTANAIGSAAPTPGGLGAVEAALVSGLTVIAKLDLATATSAMLLFRLLTFWLPVLPGWMAFTYLQRKDAL